MMPRRHRTGSREVPGDLPLLEDLRSHSLDIGQRRNWDILEGMTLGRLGPDKKEEMLLAASYRGGGTETPNVDRYQPIIAMETCYF
ncbi:BQ5605_C008g05338 [Microbotryum silenes-dioicae]|uniref:BQ5605_C008g05338 protein n=1 Tax=Microbotryum silenes-dioicae TaxID=796604 RepID=A0A2X0PEW0_9BASI|nr:BQ5605_C008g05338 [Microbotryum silenes-dioicae]